MIIYSNRMLASEVPSQSFQSVARRQFGDASTIRIRQIQISRSRCRIGAGAVGNLERGRTIGPHQPAEERRAAPLKGSRRGQWAITVNGPWRICGLTCRLSTISPSLCATLAGLWSEKSRPSRDRATRRVCPLFQVHQLGRPQRLAGQRLSSRSAKSQASQKRRLKRASGAYIIGTRRNNRAATPLPHRYGHTSHGCR